MPIIFEILFNTMGLSGSSVPPLDVFFLRLNQHAADGAVRLNQTTNILSTLGFNSRSIGVISQLRRPGS